MDILLACGAKDPGSTPGRGIRFDGVSEYVLKSLSNILE